MIDPALIQVMHARGMGRVGLSRLLLRLRRERHTMRELVGAPDSQLIDEYGLKPDVLESIRSEMDRALEITDSLEALEIKITSLGDDDYPERTRRTLGDKCPPVLFYHGNSDLFNCPTGGICGARAASQQGIQLAALCATGLSENGVSVASGYANGIDMVAHQSALNHGGSTIFVLATGILHFYPKGLIADLLGDDNYLVVSEFLPKIGWLARNAMTRNATICGLSRAMIVIEAGLSGGTFEAGTTALELGVPLFVIDNKNSSESAPGNAILLKRGAIAVSDSSTGVPNLDSVLQTIESGEIGHPQLDLLD